MLDFQIQKVLSRKNFTRQYKSVFGVSKIQFDLILEPFAKQLTHYEAAKAALRLSNPHRKNKAGGGIKSTFTDPSTCLAFVLFYLKQYPTFDTLGFNYGICGSHANRLFYAWYPLLFKALQELDVMPATDFETAEEFQAFLKSKDINTILVDVTERLIQRPKYEQEEYYSGKKKAYCKEYNHEYHL